MAVVSSWEWISIPLDHWMLCLGKLVYSYKLNPYIDHMILFYITYWLPCYNFSTSGVYVCIVCSLPPPPSFPNQNYHLVKSLRYYISLLNWVDKVELKTTINADMWCHIKAVQVLMQCNHVLTDFFLHNFWKGLIYKDLPRTRQCMHVS